MSSRVGETEKLRDATSGVIVRVAVAELDGDLADRELVMSFVALSVMDIDRETEWESEPREAC